MIALRKGSTPFLAVTYSTMKPRKESMRDSYARRQREKLSQSNGNGPASSFKPQKARVPIKRVGKRTVKRQKMNAELNRLGINHCEIGLEGCAGSFWLTWAHSKKSRFLVTDEDWLHAARACMCCHMKIETWTHAAMFDIVSRAIDSR